MLKEDDLVACVLASLQAHIRNVVSLDELLASINEDQINHEEIAKLKSQIADNKVKLEEARQFKATLYENYIDQMISKKEYQDLKRRYTGQMEQAQAAIGLLREQMEHTANSASDRLRWTQHFKEFSAMTTLDRRAVIAMVQSIRVKGKNDLIITFRYQIEYAQALKKLERAGQLSPSLREMLPALETTAREVA